MDRTQIDAMLREIFSDLFQEPPEAFSSASSPDSVEKWDSLAHVKLVSAVEEQFHVAVPPEDQADMLTFELAGDVVAGLLAKKK